jgi:GT2 family glycosyltransferase
MPSVAILIPHYNDPKILESCLDSLGNLSSESPSCQILLIDDASTDDSAEWIEKNHPEVELVRREENGGFVAAIESGIENSESEILVFLNNDTRVEPEWLKNLVEPLLAGKVEGATGSVILDWEGTQATFIEGTINYLGFGFANRGEIPKPEAPPIPLLFVCGGAMALSRRLYKEIGGFDRSFGSIYEDLDLGWRLNTLGYDCRLIPTSQVYHRDHVSFGRMGYEKKASLYIGNSLRTVFKNSDERNRLKRIELAVTLAQARERVTLLGENLKRGLLERIGGFFQTQGRSTPIVDALVSEEERTRELAEKRRFIQANRKRSGEELFDRFVPNPTRGWYYDEEQNRLLEEKRYWEFEREMYERYGL